jgi:hypothetical protein
MKKIIKTLLVWMVVIFGFFISNNAIATSGYTLQSNFSPALLPCLVVMKPYDGLRYRLVSDGNTGLVLKKGKDGYNGDTLLLVDTVGSRWNNSSKGCKTSSTNPNPDVEVVYRYITYGSGNKFTRSPSKTCTPKKDPFNEKFCSNYDGEEFIWTFSCMESGKDTPTSLSDSSTEVKLLTENEVKNIKSSFVDGVSPAYDYYDVIAHPNKSSEQKLNGVIRVKRKEYTLSVDAGVGTTVTVNRSYYGETATVFSGTNKKGTATIYEGESLAITMTLSSGYTWTSHTIVGKNLNDTTSTSVNHTVGANVSVTTRAANEVVKYTLKVDRGQGTGVVVKKVTSSGLTTIVEKGACSGTGETTSEDIYGKDKINVVMSVCDGSNYYWSSHSVVGKDLNNTSDTTVSNHTVGANVTVTTRAVQKFTLKAQAINIAASTPRSKITGTTDTTSGLVQKGNKATVDKPTVSGYKFLCWGTNKDAASPCSSGASTAATYSVDSISANTTVYAFYVKEWTLTKDQGTGTTITVTRSSSPYGGGDTGNLANNATLYEGDKISATFSLSTGYSWGSHSFVGKDVNNTSSTTISNHVVGANVSVTSSANQNKYKITAKAVDVTTKTIISGITDTTSSEVTYGQKATVTKPTATGYKFLGWSTSPNADKNALTNADSDTYTINSMTGNTTVYAYYVKEWKLTISAGTGTTITVNRVSSTYGGGGTGNLANNATLYQGDVIGATINLQTGYSWGSHSFVGKDVDNTTDTTITHTVGADVTVTASANENTFQGKSDVGSETTGWKNTNTTVNYEIPCDPVVGCKVTFTHSLKRTNSGSVTYSITRESNYDKKGVDSKTLKNNVTESFTSGNTVVVYTDSNLTLYPGQVVCETLTFNPKAKAPDTKVSLKACALATGNAQPTPSLPSSPTSDDGTLLKMHVKNNSITGSDYQKKVYAKPGDSLTYRAVYNPVLQYTYYLKPQKMQINGGTIYPTSGINTTDTLQALYDSKKGSSLKNWNNAIAVNSTNFITKYEENFTFDKGDSTNKTRTNNHAVVASEVGRVLKETAKTNANDSVKTTPSQVTFTKSGDNVVGNVLTNDAESEAAAEVPYNFNTNVEVTADTGKTLISGETGVITYKIDILPKINDLTTDGSESQAYATVVKDAKSKVIVYTTNANVGEKAGTATFGSDSICSYYSDKTPTSCWYEEETNYNNTDNSYLNSEGNRLGKTYENLQLTIDVPDVYAGYKFCVAVALYPSSSGANNNLSASGSGTWRISNSKCFSTGKRPTFQVWGGSFYSNVDVSTSTIVKQKLSDGTIFNNSALVFSSWVEQSVVSNAEVKGLASGASTGLASNAAGGGSLESGQSGSYCQYRVPLSFANYAKSSLLRLCTSDSSAGVTGESGINIKTDKESLIDPLPEEDSFVKNDYANNAVVNFTIGGDKNTIRHIGVGSLTINAATIPAGKTHIVKANGNITINGNIQYADAAYTAITEIPKLIILATGNININCGVKRIDAVLIAKDTVTTCSSSDNINNAANSNQLVVNGAILTGGLVFNRTFGAGIGAYSKIPAEIVNFDTSLLLWGRGKVDTDDTKIRQVYEHELAPRY